MQLDISQLLFIDKCSLDSEIVLQVHSSWTYQAQGTEALLRTVHLIGMHLIGIHGPNLPSIF